MLISKELNEAINGQIGREFGASLQYLNIATYFEAEAFPRLASFFYKQAEEEHEHAMKFLKYVVKTGGHVAIPPVDAPRSTFESAEETFQLALDWEHEVTRQVNHLYDIARDQHDYAAQNFLDWFVEEQIEEVGTMENLLKIVRRAGEKNLIMLEAYITHEG